MPDRRPRPLSAVLLAIVAALASFSGAAAQETDRLGRLISSGTAEEKRNALSEIRNLRTPDASRAAIPALSDPDPAVRATAAFAVIFAPTDEAFRALLPNLADPSDFVRRETAYALGAVGDPRAVDPLLGRFETDKSEEVRNACLVALGEAGDVSAVERLARILQPKPTGKTAFRRRSAARAIGRIAQRLQTNDVPAATPESFLPEKYKDLPARDHRNLGESHPAFRFALGQLVRVLDDRRESDDTRREAAFAIGAIADPETASLLRRFAGSEDAYLAEICREALLKMGIGK